MLLPQRVRYVPPGSGTLCTGTAVVTGSVKVDLDQGLDSRVAVLVEGELRGGGCCFCF